VQKFVDYRVEGCETRREIVSGMMKAVEEEAAGEGRSGRGCGIGGVEAVMMAGYLSANWKASLLF